MRSHPSRGAWIEITAKTDAANAKASRTPHGVRGLKSPAVHGADHADESHPSRGAWIEIIKQTPPTVTMNVAPLTGCVD